TGGEDGTYLLATAEVFDPGSQTWAVVDSMFLRRADHTATLLPDGRVFVAGNAPEPGVALAAELFDPVSKTWTPAPANYEAHSPAAPSGSRVYHTATLLADGRVLIAGGLGEEGLDLKSAELFDPAGQAWTFVSPMSDPRGGHTATLLKDGHVLVAGGVFYGKP